MLGKNVLNLDIKKHLWALPPETVSPYACMDVELTYQLHAALLVHLERWQQIEVYEQVCRHQMVVAWPMHMTGLKVDHKRGQALLAEYEVERERLLSDLYFNPNSAKEVLRN
jgi:DNA polymerase I-like protein with 3'-5' exonuclease and polymerase domains